MQTICQTCQLRFLTPAAAAGRRLKCPGCGGAILVAAPVAEPVAAPAVVVVPSVAFEEMRATVPAPAGTGAVRRTRRAGAWASVLIGGFTIGLSMGAAALALIGVMY